MSYEHFIEFFKQIELWQAVVAGLIVVAVAAFFAWLFKRKSQTKTLPTNPPIITAPESTLQIADGSDTTQVINIDRSQRQIKGISFTAEPGATINVNIFDYQDGVSQTEIPQVKGLFDKARAHLAKNEFRKAIAQFSSCLKLEKDPEKKGALNTQIGNCYYELRLYLKAAQFYAAGLREARKANDAEGQASNLASIGNTYCLRPAGTGQARGANVLKAVENYVRALEFFPKDKYPVQYATTQHNLGTAYTDLPSATPEQRAENVTKAIQCYQAALEIHKKDEYPLDYAMTQNNLGNAYKYLPSATPEQHAENVTKAIQCYQAALEIYKKDEYPVQYATTQNNLGVAYTDLPSATPEQRAENVTKAIQCYQAALEIHKKDEYPQDYCFTAANLGMALASIDQKTAPYWLKEAYSLRQFLPDQGKRLEDIMNKVCEN